MESLIGLYSYVTKTLESHATHKHEYVDTAGI